MYRNLKLEIIAYISIRIIVVRIFCLCCTTIQTNIVRLENGLERLKGTAAQVEDLKAKLAAQEHELTIKNDQANKLIQVQQLS